MNRIFVIGLNEFNLNMLRSIRGQEQHEYYGILDPSELYDTEYFPIPDMLQRAEAQIRAEGPPVDAIVGYMDFPVSTMLPILCSRFGTTSPTLESLLKCEHKYWSRLVQREAIPKHVPAFTAFDPFDDDALARIADAGLSFPFFVKPIKSSGSRLGFRIDSPHDFAQATARLRAEIGSIAEPFDFVLDHAELPEEVATVTGGYCMAEEIIGGHQCTVEGYVYQGEVVPYGIVDSIRYPGVISFFSYQYPSKLPARVQRKMRQLTQKVMAHIGFDNSAFNIEFFWDEMADRIWLLEINTRISQSHCDLFAKVDGVTNQQVSVDLALGRRPDMPSREGPYPIAGKFFYRVFVPDATVRRVPTEAEIADIEARIPGTIIRPQVHEGMRLSDLPEQDSYSYAVAYIFMGAKNRSTLLRNYKRTLQRLKFEFGAVESHVEPVEAPMPE